MTRTVPTAFLLALRAKGYHPQVIVTDLRQDYGPVIAQVFPQAVHHECIFHALQQAQKHVKDVYGPDYAAQHPEAEQLKQQIYAIFDADTLALATERYTAVLALPAGRTSKPGPRPPSSLTSWSAIGPGSPTASTPA